MGLVVQAGNFPPRRPYGPRRVRNRNKRWEAFSGSPGSIGLFGSDRFAREVEQAVAVVLVLLIPCLDLGGEAVGQRCREGVEAVEDIDDLPLGGVRVEKGWHQKSPTAVTASLETRPTMDGEPER